MHPLSQKMTSFSGTAKEQRRQSMLVPGREPNTYKEALSVHRCWIITFHTTSLPLFTFPQQLFLETYAQTITFNS